MRFLLLLIFSLTESDTDSKTNPKERERSSSKLKLKTIAVPNQASTKNDSKDHQPPKMNLNDKVVIKANGKTIAAERVVGNGSFGVVVRAVIQESNEVVAIKKVLQDKRYKVSKIDAIFEKF